MKPGESITKRLCEIMPACSTCGSRPRDYERPAHPRRVEVMAMGKLWKVHVVCMICGSAIQGKTFADALNGWRTGRAPKGMYDLPEDGRDLKPLAGKEEG